VGFFLIKLLMYFCKIK